MTAAAPAVALAPVADPGARAAVLAERERAAVLRAATGTGHRAALAARPGAGPARTATGGGRTDRKATAIASAVPAATSTASTATTAGHRLPAQAHLVTPGAGPAGNRTGPSAATTPTVPRATAPGTGARPRATAAPAMADIRA